MHSEKDIRTTNARGQKPSRAAGKKEKTKPFAMPPKILAPSPPTPSKPVIIPTRTRDGGRRRSREAVSKHDGHTIEAAPGSRLSSSSLATPLPMASLPDSVDHRQVGNSRKLPSFANPKPHNTKLLDPPRRSISSSSPGSWGMLLSPPEEMSEQESGSYGSDTTLGPSASFRSVSTESMPSLDTDTESMSSISNPPTPAVWNGGPRMTSDKHRKSLSTSVSTSIGKECALDHPLIPPKHQTHLEDESADGTQSIIPPTPSPLAKSRSYFKSNLTASFRKIRSAAQSLSAFTSLPTQHEDYLARTLLTMDAQFTDERRPSPSAEPPDPALRRYLNPSPFSPAELHFHSEESPQVQRNDCTASIQLQTYQRRQHESDKASSPPVFSSSEQKAMDAVDGLPQPSLPRQREPRENGDFLRVIVLEMNMRKTGKLSDTSPGRARLWLPARQAGKAADEGNRDEEEPGSGRSKIPARWASIRA